MKIALCTRIYETHGRPGGMIHVVTDRAKALAAVGHDVHVLTTARLGDGESSMIPIGNLTIHHLSCPPQKYSGAFADQQSRMVDHLQPDIVHFESVDKHRIWWGHLKCAKAVTLHGEEVGCQFTQWRMYRKPLDTDAWLTQAKWLKLADTVIATCRFDQLTFSDFMGISRSRLVYNPIASYFFEDRKEEPDWPSTSGFRPSVLFCALWGQQERGFKVAHDAAQLADVRFDCPINVPRADLVKWYDGCIALLSVGHQSQGYDLCVSEAIARQRPVVASDCGLWQLEAYGRPWIRIVPQGDVEATADAIREIVRWGGDDVPSDAADEHRPQNHVTEWLEAILG